MNNFLTESKDSLLKKASYLRLASRSIVENLKSGSFKSLYKGQGVDFCGVREYLSGDDVRAIDWNVTARLGKPYIKVFEEDHELQIFLIVDRSLSMFSGKNPLKYKCAAEIAAILTLVAETSCSPVGAVFFDGKIHFSCKCSSGKDQTMLILSKLDKVDNIQNGSALDSAIKGAVKLLKNRSLVFIISDFKTDGWQDSFKILSQKNDVIPIRITDSFDVELPQIGSVPFIDSESHVKQIFPTDNKNFRTEWKESYKKRTEKWKDFCIRHGATPLSIAADEDAVRVLSNFFISK